MPKITGLLARSTYTSMTNGDESLRVTLREQSSCRKSRLTGAIQRTTKCFQQRQVNWSRGRASNSELELHFLHSHQVDVL